MRGRPAESGFALLIVLWTLGLLALLEITLTTAGRAELRIAANLRDAARAEAAADGAVHEAMLRLLQGRWQPGPGRHDIRIGSAVVEVEVGDEATRINPNLSMPPILRALLVNVGIEPREAAALAQAIADWRLPGDQSSQGGLKLAPYQRAGLPYGPPMQAYESLEEMGLVAGMSPDILQRIEPYMSLAHESDIARGPEGSLDSAILDDARVIDRSAGSLGVVDDELDARVRAVIRVGRAPFERDAIVRLRATAAGNGGRPWTIQAWHAQAVNR